MPTQDGLVSYDLVCTVCENKVFGFRGEYGKFFNFPLVFTHYYYEQCNIFSSKLSLSISSSTNRSQGWNLKKLTEGHHQVNTILLVNLCSYSIYEHEQMKLTQYSLTFPINNRSGACGLIWLNTGKLIRSRHSEDWQIESSFLILWVVVHGRS